jgi:hypothetical protein
MLTYVISDRIDFVWLRALAHHELALIDARCPTYARTLIMVSMFNVKVKVKVVTVSEVLTRASVFGRNQTPHKAVWRVELANDRTFWTIFGGWSDCPCFLSGYFTYCRSE